MQRTSPNRRNVLLSFIPPLPAKAFPLESGPCLSFGLEARFLLVTPFLTHGDVVCSFLLLSRHTRFQILLSFVPDEKKRNGHPQSTRQHNSSVRTKHFYSSPSPSPSSSQLSSIATRRRVLYHPQPLSLLSPISVALQPLFAFLQARQQVSQSVLPAAVKPSLDPKRLCVFWRRERWTRRRQ